MRRGDQYAMFCPCGQAFPVRAGLCRPCYRARQHSRAAFAGQRDVVLDRDRRTCQGCGSLPPHPHVHHRVPGDHAAGRLVTLCPACHTRLHKLRALRRFLPPRLVPLWVEQHPGVPEQLQFAYAERGQGTTA